MVNKTPRAGNTAHLLCSKSGMCLKTEKSHFIIPIYPQFQAENEAALWNSYKMFQYVGGFVNIFERRQHWGEVPSNEGQNWALFPEKMLQDTDAQIFEYTFQQVTLASIFQINFLKLKKPTFLIYLFF